MRKLILYATPMGDLAAACDRYFAAAAPTVAQQYPPHVTLTGFFSRQDDAASERILAAQGFIEEAGPVPSEAVEVVGLIARPDWVGLEIESPWLRAIAERFAASDTPEPADDPIRLKSWLHLSLAYGVDDLASNERFARRMVDPGSQADWEVALWELGTDNTWHRLTKAPVVKHPS